MSPVSGNEKDINLKVTLCPFGLSASNIALYTRLLALGRAICSAQLGQELWRRRRNAPPNPIDVDIDTNSAQSHKTRLEISRQLKP